VAVQPGPLKPRLRLLQLDEGPRRLAFAGERQIGAAEPAFGVFREQPRSLRHPLVQQDVQQRVEMRGEQPFQTRPVTFRGRVGAAIAADIGSEAQQRRDDRLVWHPASLAGPPLARPRKTGAGRASRHGRRGADFAHVDLGNALPRRERLLRQRPATADLTEGRDAGNTEMIAEPSPDV
jgi:hypothetical protein